MLLSYMEHLIIVLALVVATSSSEKNKTKKDS